jgi:hypothetical protein
MIDYFGTYADLVILYVIAVPVAAFVTVKILED